MGFLKGLGLTVLSILLFLSLSLFGVAFMLKSTVLNPDFVAAQVARIDVSELVREIVAEQMAGQLPEGFEFIEDAIYDVIDEQEPLLKEQVNGAIYDGYDYLLGKTDRLEISVSLAALKESLRDSLWQAFNDYLSSELSELPDEIIKPLLDEYSDDLLTQVPEEYLPPELAGLPEEELRQYIDKYYDDIVGELPEMYLPPDFTEMIEQQMEPYFDQYYQEYVGQIPDEYSFDESSIPAEAMEQIRMIREYIGYFMTGYYVLIGFMLLLAALIILINRDVRGSCRTLGIDLFVYGALGFAGILLTRSFDPMAQFQADMLPASLQTWMAGLTNDLMAPMQTFSLWVLVIGVVLLVVSFVYRQRAAED